MTQLGSVCAARGEAGLPWDIQSCGAAVFAASGSGPPAEEEECVLHWRIPTTAFWRNRRENSIIASGRHKL